MVTRRTELSDRRVIIYDPNPVNPYGQSLAYVLSELGVNVELFKAGTESKTDDPWRYRWLFGHRSNSASGLPVYALRRLLAPLRVVAVARRSPVVLVWVRSAWERRVFAFAAHVGGRFIQICHNPPGSRTDVKRSGQGDLPIPKVLQVVHSARLVQSYGLPASTLVAGLPLPLIGRTSENVKLSRSQAIPVFLFLGERRFDKGFDLVEEIIRGISSQILEFEFVIAGRGPAYRPRTMDRLTGLTLTDLGLDRFLSDEELLSEVARATLLIAPYREATQSATIVLAFNAGLNAVGFNVGAIPDLLRSEALAARDDVQDLVDRACRFAVNHETTYRLTVDEYRGAVKKDWERVIAHSFEGDRV